MFRHYSPGVTFFSLIAAGILKLLPARKKRTPTAPKGHVPYLNEMQRVVDEHKDCTAEVFNIFVSGRRKVEVFGSLTPGDKVSVRLDGDKIAVSVGNMTVATADIPENSHLPEAFRQDVDIDAYLGGRDVMHASEEADFASIIAFYKLEGVPPTHVDLQ